MGNTIIFFTKQFFKCYMYYVHVIAEIEVKTKPEN